MPSDDYAVAGGGALKLKGAKVDKKKKKKKSKTNLEKNLAAGDDEGALVKKGSPAADSKEKEQHKEEEEEEEEHNDAPQVRKTEAELRYEEYKKRRLLKMAESSASRPELLKTHKERVEELNTYLSKLSEHHDMPKIGPG